MFTNNLVLIGFMGSGKSTIAKYLQQIYGMQLVEMDEVIAEREGMSIPEIFANHGEEYFREMETCLLKNLQFEKNIVISCGGGVPLREENVILLKKIGKVILLDASPQTVYERVKNHTDRPLLYGKNHVEGITELMNTRRKKYEEAADITVNTDNKTVESIVEEITHRIKREEEQ